MTTPPCPPATRCSYCSVYCHLFYWWGVQEEHITTEPDLSGDVDLFHRKIFKLEGSSEDVEGMEGVTEILPILNIL